jgi:hypothetical protein
MEKRQSSSQPTESNSNIGNGAYKKALEEALEEYNEYLRSAQRKENNKYCIKCRSRVALEGLEFCKHCNGSVVDIIRPRMRRNTKKIIIKKRKTNIKRNKSLKHELKG